MGRERERDLVSGVLSAVNQKRAKERVVGWGDRVELGCKHRPVKCPPKSRMNSLTTTVSQLDALKSAIIN